MGWGVMGNGGVGNGRVVGTALEGGRMIVVTRKHHCVHGRSTAFLEASRSTQTEQRRADVTQTQHCVLRSF